MKYLFQFFCACVLAIGLFTACSNNQSTTSTPASYEETEAQTVPVTEDL